MLNSIPKNQNTQSQLERLAAQRHLYSSAKTVLAIQLILAVPIALLWSLVVAYFPGMKSYAALWGICVVLIDTLILDYRQRLLCRRAAKIQELFDCEVLSLEWNVLVAQRKPDREAVLEASEKYKHKDGELLTLKDWYPTVVGQLPLHLARLICQRANCWWDAKLRRRYANGIVIVLCTLAFIVFVIGLMGGMSLEKFILAVAAPLSPAIAIGIREYRKHIDAAESADRLKEYTDDLWHKAMQSETLEQLQHDSRKLQDAIYNRRCNSALVFDRIYLPVRPNLEVNRRLR